MMSRFATFTLSILGSASLAFGQTASPAPKTPATAPLPLDPPKNDGGPVVVHASFFLRDINNIDDEASTFEFSGVLRLQWMDKRQAFDPHEAGTSEKIFQGAYQFDEISPGWYPQEVLVNESGRYDKHAVILRSQPDGTQILMQAVNAVAKAEFSMRRFPFDSHRLEAVFHLFGFDKDEVVLQAHSEASKEAISFIRIPQWTVTGIETSTVERTTFYTGKRGVGSGFVLSIHVQRDAFYIVRLIMIPLAIITFLSFSVFWMDRSSLGDRINVSFIGILTGVAYQIVTKDILPHISYVTLIHAFLNMSFLTMCATVVMNLVVGAYDKKGQHEIGNRIDRRCRWLFPLAYGVVLAVAFSVAFIFF